MVTQSWLKQRPLNSQDKHMTSEQMKLFVEHIIESENLRRSWNDRISVWQQKKEQSGLWNGKQKEWGFETLQLVT